MGKYRNHSNERPINDSPSPNSASSSSSPSHTHENGSSFPTENDPILAFSNAEREGDDTDPQTSQHLNPKFIKAISFLRSAQFTLVFAYSSLISPIKGNLAVYMTVALFLTTFVVVTVLEIIRNDRVNMKTNFTNWGSFAEISLLVGDAGLCAFFICQMNAVPAGRLYSIMIIACALNAAMFLVTTL
jgi:hypothetical protein